MIMDIYGFDSQRVRDLVAQGHSDIAMDYMRDLSDRGSVRAMIGMADYYFDNGDQLSSLQCMKRAERSVATDDFDSMIFLASAYERGLGEGGPIERQKKSLDLLELIADAGNVRVMHALMTNYLHGINGAPRSHEKFPYWTRRAAELGSAAAIQALKDIEQK
jgi:TPR repeat protein